MGKQDNKVGKVIKVTYQAPNAESGLTDVTMSIYDETDSLDGIGFPDVVMTEKDTTGRYSATFTPDEKGEWRIHIAKNAGSEGKLFATYSVGDFDVQELGEKITVIESKVDAVDSPPMIG